MTPTNHLDEIAAKLRAVRTTDEHGRTLIAGPELGGWVDVLAGEVSRMVADAKAEALREYADLAASREHHMSAPRFKSAADGRERNIWGLVKHELRQRADRLPSPEGEVR